MQNIVTTTFASASASVVLLSPQTSRSGRHAAQFVKISNSFPIELGRKNRTARILVVFSGVKAFFCRRINLVPFTCTIPGALLIEAKTNCFSPEGESVCSPCWCLVVPETRTVLKQC
jgi:hypothetical protein